MAEFKRTAVKHAQAMGIGVASRELGLVEQTLRNWGKAADAGKLRAGAARDARADGVVQAARGERAAEDACRNIKKSDGVLWKGCAVKYAWIDAQRLHNSPNLCEVLDVSVEAATAPGSAVASPSARV